MSRRIFDPNEEKRADFYRLMVDCVGPRPIAWVSTISSRGETNLAPFSFFMGVGSDPPTLAFSCATPRPSARKDTLANIEETGQFVIAVVTEDNAVRMNQTSFDYPHGTSEFDHAGIASFPAQRVKALCVADSPVNFECELVQVVRTGDRPGSGNVIVARILLAHVDERVLVSGMPRADADLLKLVGRMGGNDYAFTRDRMQILRPMSEVPTEYNPKERPAP